MPSSTELVSSVTLGVLGTVADPHRVQGQLTVGGLVLVVNVQVTGAAMVLPHRSAACTEAVYVVFSPSSVDGVKVALLEALRTLLPGTAAPPASLRVKARVSASMPSLKVAPSCAVIAVPVAADCGVVEVTEGGVVLAEEVSRTASTQ